MIQPAGKILTPKECKLIEAALVAQNLSKREASRQLGRPHGYLWDVLHAVSNPSDAQLKAIAKVLGLTFVASVPARIE